MKRILPDEIFRGAPCSTVAVGCALHVTNRNALRSLVSKELHDDGYLSLAGMNRLVRANLSVVRRVDYRRGQRPTLRDFCHKYVGRAIVCVEGHFLYVEGGNYYSFFFNGSDRVVCVWFIDKVYEK